MFIRNISAKVQLSVDIEKKSEIERVPKLYWDQILLLLVKSPANNPGRELDEWLWTSGRKCRCTWGILPIKFVGTNWKQSNLYLVEAPNFHRMLSQPQLQTQHSNSITTKKIRVFTQKLHCPQPPHKTQWSPSMLIDQSLLKHNLGQK